MARSSQTAGTAGIVAPINPVLDAEFRAAGTWGDEGIHDLWLRALAQAPGRQAVVDSRGFQASYQQVDDHAARLASCLRGAGVRRGDVVSAVLPNWGEYLAVNVACLKLGAIINPVLFQHRYRELRDQLDRCGSTALIVATSFHHIDHIADVRRLVAHCPRLLTVLTVGRAPYDDWPFLSLEQTRLWPPLPEGGCTPGRGNDVAVVLFTSGSEAAPKGVLLTHNNVLASERGFISAIDVQRGERMFMPASLAHATGYLHGMTMPIMAVGTSILLDRFTGPDALMMINTHLATCAMGSTTIVRETVAAAESGPGFHPGLKRICCGGAPVPRALVEHALAMGVSIHSVYGATESAPHTMTRVGDPVSKVVGTDGRPVPGTRIRIVDTATRAPLPPGREGEEASRGPAVFSGYLDDPERTAAVLDEDGWYYSGDLAVMDAQGYIRITGRIKDTIVRGGENISAREVEELLLAHPCVHDAAVVAMPDVRLGERVCAFLVLRPGSPAPTLDQVRDFFAEHDVIRFKTPERIEILDALPSTPTGKVSKVELRHRIAALLDAECSGRRTAGKCRA